MEINSQINTFEGGMDMDTDVRLVKNNTYRYAENVRLITDTEGTTGILQNAEYIKMYEKSDDLKNQKILYTLAVRMPINNVQTNVAILITKDVTSLKQNNIILIYDFDKSKLQYKKIINILWGFDESNNITAHFLQETDKIFKLYVNDPLSGLKIINLENYINNEDTTIIEDPSYFDSIPLATLPPLKLQNIISGNLKSGTFQYYYKLFNQNSTETALSAGSELIYLAEQKDNSSKISGFDSDIFTTCGCRISLTTNNEKFDRIRIYRVYWKDATNLPEISIIVEDRISKGDINVTFSDTVWQSISTVSNEEFSDIVPYVFTAQCMCAQKNRLFFANVQQSDWDIDYDARAYRANKKGTVLIKSITNEQISFQLASLDESTVEDTFDCINPMNEEIIYPSDDEDLEYAWGLGEKRGGHGINIDYEFVKGIFYEDDSVFDESGKLQYKVDSNNQTKSSTVELYNPDLNSKVDSVQLPSSHLLTHADSYIASTFQSYQRDETYRFGIVFYNTQNIASPVHWIGDIRIPSADTAGYETFGHSNDKELTSYPIGIRFTVRNIPANVVAYEIVRCDRTQQDRTVTAQGIWTKALQFTALNGGQVDTNVSLGSKDARPAILPVSTDLCRIGLIQDNNLVGFYQNYIDDIAVFASPEQSMNKTSEIIDSTSIAVPIYVSVPDVQIKDNLPDQDNLGKLFGINDSINAASGKQYGFGRVPKTGTLSSLSVGYTGQSNVQGGLIKMYNLQSADTFSRTYGAQLSLSPFTNKIEESTRFYTRIKDAKIATNLPNESVNGLSDYKGTYTDSIGGYLYTNASWGYGVWGIHGVSTVVQPSWNEIESGQHFMLRLFSGATTSGKYDDIFYNCLTLITNIKKQVSQYGGASYANRSTNQYITCAAYKKYGGEEQSSTVNVFGGDTYLGIFDYQQTAFWTKNNWEDSLGQKAHVQLYIPIESTINPYMRCDEHYIQQTDDTNLKNERIYHRTTVGMLNGVSQDKEMYAYNAAYSVSDSAIKLVPKSLYAVSDSVNNNRISVTESKTNGEIVDSWSKNKFANYLDVDNKYGQITNLVAFKDKLYFFQDNALGVASVNERSLITDDSGSSLVLGDGGVLSRYDYVLTDIGDSVINDKSIVTTGSTLYWFDNNKNVICSVGDNMKYLSKEKNVQSYFNSLAQSNKLIVKSMYNDKTNEVWFKVGGKSLIFNEQLGLFTSFYTHCPNYGLRFFDRLVTIENKNFYHTDSFGQEDIVKDRTVSLKFVINKDQDKTKVFDNQIIDGTLDDPNDNQSNVIKEINYNTKTQNSFTIDGNDVYNREDNYRLNIPRQDRGDLGSSDENEQTVLNRSYQPRMRGKYLISNYKFDCNDDRQIRIPYIKTTYRYSNI